MAYVNIVTGVITTLVTGLDSNFSAITCDLGGQIYLFKKDDSTCYKFDKTAHTVTGPIWQFVGNGAEYILQGMGYYGNYAGIDYYGVCTYNGTTYRNVILDLTTGLTLTCNTNLERGVFYKIPESGQFQRVFTLNSTGELTVRCEIS